MERINRCFKRATAKQAEEVELSLLNVHPPGGTQDINSLPRQPNTRDFIANYPTFVCGQENHDTVILAMKLLSTCIIHGIAYDSSARTLHPCLLRTRLQLHEKIINWFYDRERRQSVLWLNALAGVRTSVIIQVLAESLTTSRHLGAALFLGYRDDTQRVLITIAFQLAVRIPSYRTFVAERITRDPGVLEGEIKEQFRMFITEPFGRSKIGEGEGPWGILLDGLDECESPDLQSEIVRLVGEFILSFPHAPLVWVIASQPLAYLGTAFTSDAMLSSHWSEYIQNDSDQSDPDQWKKERLLLVAFKVTRERFSHIPSEWPSEIQMANLTNFVMTSSFSIGILLRFIADTNYADPMSHLDQVLSVIESSGEAITSQSHTAPPDALYALILSSIPPELWEVTKRVLGFLLCVGGMSLQSGSLRAMSTILGLEKSVISQTLNGLQPVLYTKRTSFGIPSSYPLRNRRDWALRIHSDIFIWPSFSEYLTDPARSPDNFKGYQYRNDFALTCYDIYLDPPWNSGWVPLIDTDCSHDLRNLVMKCVYYLLTGGYGKRPGRDPLLDAELRSECLGLLSQINVIELYLHRFWVNNFSKWLIELWDKFSDECRSKGLVEEVQLRDLTFNHLDCRRNKPLFVLCRHTYTAYAEAPEIPWTLRAFIKKLRRFQRDSPAVRVLICGSIPERRNALFSLEFPERETRYYCVPYPY